MAFFVVAALALGACAPGETPAATPAPDKEAPSAVPVVAGWQQRWDNILAEARKEGVVTIYAGWSAEARTALTQAFKARYGIDAEFTPFTGGPQMLAKASAEHRAGLFYADLFGGGSTTLFSLRDPGISTAIEPLLILPEVLDTNAWLNQRLPFLDKDKKALSMIYSIQHRFVYNIDMVGKGEITSYKDVLNPRYRGKMIMEDPSVSGAGNGLMGSLAQIIWNMEEAKDYLRQLLRLDVLLLRDQRLLVENVARGKYPIAIAPNSAVVANFLDLKAPIEIAFPREGVMITTGASSGLAVAARMAHPNAGVVFLNWLLSKEGQTTLSKSVSNPSRRVDVPTEWVNPVFVPRPDMKLFWDSEEFILFQLQMQKVAKDIIDEFNAKK